MAIAARELLNYRRRRIEEMQGTMNKRELSKLRVGTSVSCANHEKDAEATLWWLGTVIEISDNSRILVQITEGKTLYRGWSGPGTGPGAGTKQWFHYRCVSLS